MTNKVDQWLADFGPHTQEQYRSRMRIFFNETGTTEETLDSMSAMDIKHLVIQWRNKSIEQGKAQNTILSIVAAIRSYCASDYVEKPLVFKKAQLGKIQADIHSHVWSTNDLKAMFDISDVFEKALLSTAVSLGWEVSSFRNLDRERIKLLLERAKANGENYVFFEDVRKKEGEPRLGVLNPLAIKWLTQYLETNTDQTPKLFLISRLGVGKMLRRLAKQANIKLTGEPRFHRIRSYVASSLSRAGFNEYQISFIMGHALEARDRGYLLTLKAEIEEKYPLVYEQYLDITHNGTNGETKRKLSSLELENEKLKQTIGELTQQLKEQTSTTATNESRLNELFKEVEALKQGQQKAAAVKEN